MELWNAEKCAENLGNMKAKTFLRNYAPRPDFPKRISLPHSKRPLWKSNEVMEWALKFQEKR